MKMELCLVIILLINLVHTRVTSGVIKLSADQCDRYVNRTYTCYQVHKVGAKAVLKINVNGAHEPDDIKWFRRVKIREKTSPLLLGLEDDGKLPRNMFLSHDCRTLEVIKIRNYDTASNSFKVEVKSRQNHVNFVIDVQPVELGPNSLGSSLVIDINDYIQLPQYASSLHWYIEGARTNLPGNAKLQDDGKKLAIHRIEDKDYQMYVCVVYSDKNYFLAKRRFQLLRAQQLTKDPETYPSTVYRPLGSSVSFKVKVHGASKSLLKWYKDETLLNPHHGILVSGDQQHLRIPKIKRGMFGTYTCILQGTERTSSINVHFDLQEPVIPFKDKLSHDWNFDVLRSTEDELEVLDLATGMTSTAQVSVGCLEPAKGVSGEAMSMNIKHKSCDGNLELLDSDLVDECVVDPENCQDGFSLSIWLKLKMPPSTSYTDVVCTRPRGLCITCKGSKPREHLLECVADITTLDQRWHLAFKLQSAHWQFLVITWSPFSECRVLVNGEMKVSTLGQSIAKPAHGTQTAFVLGLADVRMKSDTAHLCGLVDELLIWYQAVLSPKQVATMFIQFHGLNRPDFKEVIYNHTVEAGDSLKLTCPFDLPPVFRSHLHWIAGGREIDEYAGRLSIILPVDRPQVFTCQYFNGSDMVASEKFFVFVNGYKSIVGGDGSEHSLDMSKDTEPVDEDDAHHQEIQDDQEKDDIDYKEYPCLSYPCKHDGTCRHRQHVFILNDTEHTAYTYQCQCTHEYRGLNCEQELTSCDAYPCENGKCLDDDTTDTGFHCLCYYGYQGETCSEDINECDDVNDCSPHADCINSPGSYSCACQGGYEGDGKHCIATAVHVTLRDARTCTSVLTESRLCIIETDKLRTCDITFSVNISGVYKVNDVVWSKHWAKLNLDGPSAIEYKVEATNFMVIDNGTRKGVKCWESDFADNFFKVEVRNGHIPPPSFMFKLVHHSIELGPKIPGTPFELSVYYYGVFPDNSWTGKWVNQASGNFSIVAPPRLTYEYREESLESGDLGFLIYYGYDEDGYQVATRTFHDEPDVDECLEWSGNCLTENSECENLPGSYRCVCHAGYLKVADSCKDVDECLQENHCHPSARCANTVGSYSCTCLEGFHGDGRQCTEVDCPLLGHFENGRIVGLSHSFRSTVLFRCYKGYRLEGSHKLTCKETGIWSALKPGCIDINECEVTNYCDSNAICHNKPGNYRCDCKSGYKGDGMRCADIDECEESANPCHEHAVCINRDGGFGCTCFHQALGSPSSDCTGGATMPPALLKKHSSVKVNFADLAEVLPFMEYEDFNTSIQFPGRATGQLSEESFHQGDHVLALEGSSYDIPCIPYSIMNSMVMLDPEYVWIRDGGATLNPDHYKPSENGNLHFFQVGAEDSGPFKCRISYSDISGGGFKEITYNHELSVYATATPLCEISVTYFTEACHHATNYEHRNSFLGSLAKKVCLQVGCTVLEFDMECHRVQENVGTSFSSVHQLDYAFTLQVNIREFVPCNVTCVVTQLQSHVGQVLSALDEFVRQEEVKAKGNQVYKIMSNSWTHTVSFVCSEGYARRDYICVACPPGSSSIGEVCHPCRRGYYQSNFTSRNCEACPHQQITKAMGSLSLKQCYVEKLGEKILGGIIGGVVTLGCILAVIIYRIVVKHCKGTAQDIALRRLSEAVEDTMEMAKDTIKTKAKNLAFRAEIAKSEYTDKMSKKNTQRNVKSRTSRKRKSRRKSPSSVDTDETPSKSPSEESLPTDSESYQSSQQRSQQGSPQGSQQGGQLGSHHVHFPGSYGSSETANRQGQHSSHRAIPVDSDVHKKSSHLSGYYDSHDSLVQEWSQHNSHMGSPVNSYKDYGQIYHLDNGHSLHEGTSSRSKHSQLEPSNLEYSNVKHNGHGVDNDPDTARTTPADEYHSSCEVLVDSASSRNLRTLKTQSSANTVVSHQSLPEKEPIREQLRLHSDMREEKKTVSQTHIREPLDSRIPIAPPPPPPLPSLLKEVDDTAFGFPPPPPNF